LIAARNVVLVDALRPGIQPVDLDGPIADPRRRVARGQVERRPAQLGARRADTNLAGGRLLLQLGGDVHRRAGNVEAIDRVAATLAQTDQAGMNADAKIDRMAPRSGRCAVTLDVPGRDACAIRVILEGGWPAENGNAAVARIVDDLAPEALHRAADVIQPAVQKCLGLVWITGRDMTRRTDHIDGENRYDVAVRSRRNANGHALVPRLPAWLVSRF